MLAKQLEQLLMVLTADSLKGRAQLPLVIHPALLVASHLAELLRTGLDNLDATTSSADSGSYADRLDQAVDGLKGAAEALETLAVRARRHGGRRPRRRSGGVNLRRVRDGQVCPPG